MNAKQLLINTAAARLRAIKLAMQDKAERAVKNIMTPPVLEMRYRNEPSILFLPYIIEAYANIEIAFKVRAFLASVVVLFLTIIAFILWLI